MKNLLAAASALTLLATGSAWAADITDNFSAELTALQNDVCVIGPVVDVTGDTGMDGNLTDGIIQLTDDADGTDGDAKLNATSLDASIRFGDTYCNYNHNVSLGSAFNGMVHDGSNTSVLSGSDKFASGIDYTATLKDWSGGDLEMITTPNSFVTFAGGTTAPTAASIATRSVAGAFRNDGIDTNTNTDDGVEITISASAGQLPTDPLLSGTYTDTLFMRFGATF